MKKSILFVALVLVVAVLPVSFFSCKKAERGKSTVERKTEAGEVPNVPELVVYTYDAFPQALQLSIEQHMDTMFGCEVRFYWFEDTGGLYSNLFLEKENPKADVVIGLDNTYLAKIYGEDLLVGYKPQGLQLANNALVVDPPKGYKITRLVQRAPVYPAVRCTPPSRAAHRKA